jgi:hypothetical protein
LRRTLLGMALVALLLSLSAGVAEAATIDCSGGPCEGTNRADRITGSSDADQVSARGGNDRINVRGGGIDTVDCGGGFDVVLAGANDRVNRQSCERVIRS